MMFLPAVLMCLGCDASLPAAMPAGGQRVDVELVLAVDVSRSMDAQEFALQRAGYVAALRDPAFLAAVKSGYRGQIAITYFEWAGTVRTESALGWTLIDGPESAAQFASALEVRPFGGYLGTSISGALIHASSLFDRNGFDGERQVIDISGDGPNNSGLPVTSARDAAIAAGIVVNGLPIVIRPSPTFPDIDLYYGNCVIGGPGSFLLPIRTAGEFATAIRRKLILEVSGETPPAHILPVSGEPVDCLKGERDRRFHADPFLPELQP